LVFLGGHLQLHPVPRLYMESIISYDIFKPATAYF
jgi:hypothetical protein